ncbi:uncharacterized protein BDW43DRAFT_276121 [Aspergillus alliaceus]|uniref:uncharacterized protein n=1 Tax=Petromyces alliaceus TaxID=209559 RepID=UPI0012A41A93|nr:uncharacterized protein BDW43DRAFT_276121 [Aspergillus alliaceus]KAB8233375.1 hypothetical protein BDW43DRAFT_276121 [Aspergillus alliaceus]
MLRSTFPTQPDFITCALDKPLSTFTPFDFNDDGMSVKVFQSDMDWSSPNLAWARCLDMDDEEASTSLQRKVINPLRNWGSLFWDEYRLKE